MKKYIYSSIALFLLGFMVQSCFQDMDHPGFDYPEELPEKPYNPMKLGLAFEDNLEDNSIYNFGITADGTPHFAEGINGKAYQGATDTYMVVETPEAMKDSIENLGSFTVSFWMKATKCNKATGIFGISNTKQFWGNLDIYLESHSENDTQAFFKVHLRNGNAERTEECRIDDVFIIDWVHLSFKYDETTSKLTVYKNAEEILSKALSEGEAQKMISGKLKFSDVGKLVIGTLQFQTIPSLTEGATAQDWGAHYLGALDQFHFYNKALKKSEIRNLYITKD